MRLGKVWRQLSFKNIKVLISVLVVAGLFFSLFLWHLSTLTPGLSPSEASARTFSSNLHVVANNPVFAPQTLIQYLFHKLSPGSIYFLRLASVIWAGIFIFCFYRLARRWFGRVIGILGTLLFASTPWFILSARSASPMIMLLMPLAVAACFTWAIKQKSHMELVAIALIAMVSVAIYVPGSLWFIIISSYFVRKILVAFISKTNISTRIVCSAIALLILAPLIRAIPLDWEIIKTLLLVPASFIGIYGLAKAFVWSGLAVVWRTRSHLDISVSRWPMLGVVQAVLMIFGAVAMFSQALTVGTMLLVFIAICIFVAAMNSTVLVGNGSLPFVFMALPALSMFVSAGLRYLYIEWKTIFPRNPLPKTIAVIIMATLVAMQVFFGIRYALVAWPHTADTLRLYMVK